MKAFRAHGKLLISAEYMVLHGSKALAVPLQRGQILRRIRSENRNVFSWKANYGTEVWFSASYDPTSLGILKTSDQDKAEFLPLAELKNEPLFGFCGIAQPMSFKSTILKEKLNLSDFASYPDHYLYSRPAIISMVERAKNLGAKALITTTKDFVKLKEVYVPDFPLYVLSVKLQMGQEFDAYLTNHLAGFSL